MCFRSDTHLYQITPKVVKGVLFVGYTLLFIAAVALTVFGVYHVSQVVAYNHLVPTDCRVVQMETTEDLIPCTCVPPPDSTTTADPGDSPEGCSSAFPCARLWVEFTTTEGTVINRAFLMDNLLTKENLNTQDLIKPKCSWSPCDPDQRINADDVQEQMDAFSEMNNTFRCYYDNVLYEVYLDIATDTSYMYVCLPFAPVLIVGLLLILCSKQISTVCDSSSECSQNCAVCRQRKIASMENYDEEANRHRDKSALSKKRKTLRKMPIFSLTSPETSLESIL